MKYLNQLKNKAMQHHELKTIQPYFKAIWDCQKKFEIRLNDRDFKVGDIVHLREYDPNGKIYTGYEIKGVITYIIYEFHALKKDYIIFSFNTILYVEPI